MEITARPVRTTIVFGLICGLLTIPLSVGLSEVMAWSHALGLLFWGYLAVYSSLLTRWSEKKFVSNVLPLLLALAATLRVDSISVFLLILLSVFSWIRSGICYPQHFIKGLFAEMALCLGAGLLVAVLTPVSVFSWAMAVWLFFLVQALYFVIFEIDHAVPEDIERDPFDRAREGAQKILSAGL